MKKKITLYYNKNKDLLIFKNEFDIENFIKENFTINSFFINKNIFFDEKNKINNIVKEIYKDVESKDYLHFRICELNKKNKLNLIISFPVYYLKNRDIDVLEVFNNIDYLNKKIKKELVKKYINKEIENNIY